MALVLDDENSKRLSTNIAAKTVSIKGTGSLWLDDLDRELTKKAIIIGDPIITVESVVQIPSKSQVRRVLRESRKKATALEAILSKLSELQGELDMEDLANSDDFDDIASDLVEDIFADAQFDEAKATCDELVDAVKKKVDEIVEELRALETRISSSLVHMQSERVTMYRELINNIRGLLREVAE